MKHLRGLHLPRMGSQIPEHHLLRQFITWHSFSMATKSSHSLSLESLKVGCFENFIENVCIVKSCSTSSSPSHSTTTLTVGFLVSRSCSWASKLLWLTPPVICHQQRSVICHQSLLQLVFRIFVHVFLVVGHN